MRILPRPIQERIRFVTLRLAAWEEHAAALGVSEQQVETARELAEAAEAAEVAARRARAEAVLATQRLETAMDALTRAASTIVKAARSTAEATGDPGVYTLAKIAPPESPSAAGRPPQPRIVRRELHEDGSITLHWRGTLSHRTFYRVFRRLDGESRFTLIGTVGAKSFRDTTIPAGTVSALYSIVGRRGTLDGLPSPMRTVNLGVQGLSRAAARAA